MDSYLESLSRAGVLDSEGGFTVDSARGLALLARYRLRDPYYFVLFVVSSAILSGARAIKIRWTPMALLIEDDGPPLGPEEAETIFSHLLSRRNLRLHYLCRALHALTAFPGVRFRLNSYTQSLRWTSKGLVHTSLPGGRPGNHLEIRAGLGKNVLLWGRLVWLLREQGRYLGGAVKLGWRKVGKAVNVPAGAPAGVVLSGTGYQLQARWSGHKLEKKPSPGSFSAVLWLQATASRRSEIFLLEGGVLYEVVMEGLGYPGFVAVVESPHLDKDLSGHVIDNENYQNFLDQLREEALRLLEEIADPQRLRPPWLGGGYPARVLPSPPPATAYLPAAGVPEFTYNGRFCAIGCADHLAVYDLRGQADVLRLPAARAGQFKFCPFTQVLAVICPQSRCCIDFFEVRTGQCLASYDHPQIVTDLAFSQDGMTMFVTQANAAVHAVTTEDGVVQPVFDGGDKHLEGTACWPSPDGRRLAVQRGSNLVLVEPDRQRAVVVTDGRMLGWSGDGLTLLIRRRSGVRFLDVDGKPVSEVLEVGALRHSLRLEPNGWLLSEGMDPPQYQGSCLAVHWCSSANPHWRWNDPMLIWASVTAAHNSLFAWCSPQQPQQIQVWEGVPESAAFIARDFAPERLTMGAQGRQLAVLTPHQQLEIIPTATRESLAWLGQPLATGQLWQAGALTDGLVVCSESQLWVWDFSGGQERLLELPISGGWLQARGGRFSLAGQVRDGGGRLLWSDQRAYLLSEGLALRSDATGPIQLARAASGEPLRALPDGGDWQAQPGGCSRLLPERTEIWQLPQATRLVSYSVGLAEALAPEFLLQRMVQAVRLRLTLVHPAQRWYVTLFASEAGFQVLASGRCEDDQPVSAVRLETPLANRTEIAGSFSEHGDHLAVRLGPDLHLFEFDRQHGQLRTLGHRPLTTASWTWAGSALLLVDRAYVEVCDPRGQPQCRLYFSAVGPLAVGGLLEVWRQLQPVQTGLPPATSTVAPTTVPETDFCPGCQGIEFSPDGAWLLTHNSDFTRLWQVSDGSVLWRGPGRACLGANHLAVLQEGRVRWLELPSGQEQACLGRQVAAFTHTSEGLFLIESDGQVLRVDFESGQIEPLGAAARSDLVLDCHPSPDGRWLAVQGQLGVDLICLAGRFLSYRLEERQFLSWSPDSHYFLTQCGFEVESNWVLQHCPTPLGERGLLAERLQLSYAARWLVQRSFEVAEGGYACRGGRVSHADIQFSMRADAFALHARQLAFSRGLELALATFPVAEVEHCGPLLSPCQRLEYSADGRWLAAFSAESQVEILELPACRSHARLGRPLAPGKGGALVRTAQGMALRTDRQLWLWHSNWSRWQHEGPLSAPLQTRGHWLAHAHSRDACQVLNADGQVLWEAPDVLLLEDDKALMRQLDGEVWLVHTADCQPLFPVRDFPYNWSLRSLAQGASAATWASYRWAEDDNVWNRCPHFWLATPHGLLVLDHDCLRFHRGSRSFDTQLSNLEQLPVNGPFTLHPEGDFLIFAEGSTLQSYDLRSGKLRGSRSVLSQPVTTPPQCSQDGRRLAVRVGRKLLLFAFDPGTGLPQLLPGAAPRLPPDSRACWLGNSLAVITPQFVEFFDGDGASRLQLYLQPDGFEISANLAAFLLEFCPGSRYHQKLPDWSHRFNIR